MHDITKIPPAAQVLITFKPQHDFFIGIDSDGCAFDVMDVKQKECFTPVTIRAWGLQPIYKYAREAELIAEFEELLPATPPWQT